MVKIKGWYVEPEHGEEYTEIVAVAELSPSYGLAARIGYYDDESMEEFIHRYWWRVVCGEQGWINKGGGDSFADCATQVQTELNAMHDEIREGSE